MGEALLAHDKVETEKLQASIGVLAAFSPKLGARMKGGTPTRGTSVGSEVVESERKKGTGR